MTTPTGQIGLSDVNVELGRASTTSINMNESAVRTLAGVASGAISMNDLRGKSNRVTSNITISANTTNYVLNTAKVTGYVAGKTDVTLTINSGVFVYSTSTGSYALQVDTSWTTGDTVKIVNNGVIIGRGGNGGNGSPNSTGGAGGNAGPALYVQRATTFTNGVGRIAGGGGGGGGGAGRTYKTAQLSGGGGGGGIGVSSGGSSVSAGNPGSAGGAGTLTSAGGGGAGYIPGSYNTASGGNGGSYASSGSAGGNTTGNDDGQTHVGGSGGSGGLAIQGYSNISWVSTGTINGGTAG